MDNKLGMLKLREKCTSNDWLFEDEKVAEPLAKLKTENKLVRNEGRMFYEKMVFLSKSMSKYAVVGVHPLTFKPHMKICDRSTGTFFPVTMAEFVNFIQRVKCLLNNEVFEDVIKVFDVNIIPLSENVWKFESIEGNGVAMHRICLEKLLRVEPCIFYEMTQRLYFGESCKDVVEKIRYETVDFDERKILEHLNKVRENAVFISVRYHVVFDLICNHDYFLTLEEYNEGFFRRIKSL